MTSKMLAKLSVVLMLAAVVALLHDFGLLGRVLGTGAPQGHWTPLATGALLLSDGLWPISEGQSKALLRAKVVLGAATILAVGLGLTGS